jgi:hypothetical protein
MQYRLLASLGIGRRRNIRVAAADEKGFRTNRAVGRQEHGNRHRRHGRPRISNDVVAVVSIRGSETAAGNVDVLADDT